MPELQRPLTCEACQFQCRHRETLFKHVLAEEHDQAEDGYRDV